MLEGPVLLGVFKGLEDGLGREPVPEGVPPGLPLSGFGLRACALESVVAARLDLPEGRHGRFDSAAALPFAISSVESGKAGETLGVATSLRTGCGSGFGRVASQSSRAIRIGSIRAVFHHAGSLRERWSSR